MWVKEVPSTGKIRYCERYTDYLTGKRKDVSVTFDKDTARNRKEAQRILNEKIREKQNPLTKEFTLHELIVEYRKDLELSVKASTFRRNGFAVQAAEDLIGKDVLVSRLTPRIIKTRFLKSGKPPKTLNGYLKRLKGVLFWAYRNDLIDDLNGIDKMERFQDPSEKKNKTKPKSTKKLKYMERAELITLLNGLTNEQHKLMTRFLALSGMRSGELIALHKEDIDLENHVIHICRTYDPNNEIETTTKTADSEDDLFIQPELEACIREINSFMLQRQLRHGLKKQELFMFTEKGKHIPYYTFNKYLKENTERIIGKALTTHSLRHTHASLLFEMGFTVQEVQDRLRHADERITREIYIHVTQRLKEKYNDHLQNTKIL